MVEFARRQIGRTGLQVTELGLGCATLGGSRIGVARDAAEAIVSAAWEAGVRYVDTAPFYGVGQAERCVGDALRDRPRDEWVLSTKVGRLLRPNPTGIHPDGRHHPLPFDPVYDYSYDGSRRACNGCRPIMSTSIWCIGRTSKRRSTRRSARSTTSCGQGKARYIGVSNFRLTQIEACMQLRRIDVVQYGWNMFDRRMADEIFPYCAAQQIGVMAYGSLLRDVERHLQHRDAIRGGRLALARRHARQPQLFRTLFGPEHFPRNLRAVDDLKRLAAKYDKTLPQFALRWTLSNPTVGTALVGFRDPAEVTENLGALGWTISAADMVEIDAILARHGCVTVPPGWLED